MSTRRPRPRWTLPLAGYGAAWTLLLLATAVLGDRTVTTYTAGLAAFWGLLLAVPLLAVAVAARAWPAAAALVVPALVAAVLWGPLLLPGRGGGTADLRVATFNATHGQPVGNVTALVRATSPDVLLLQEVTPALRVALERTLTRYPYRSFSPLRHGDGSAVLSRFPITGVSPVPGLPRGARAADVVTVRAGGRDLALLSVHLASPCLTCTHWGWSSNPAGDPREAARVRVTEARRYAQVARRLRAAGDAVVVGGDLNSSDLNQPLRILTSSGLTDVHRAVGTRPGLTRGPGPGLARVDAVLVSGLRPVHDATGARGTSTHSPVIADLAWERPRARSSTPRS